MLATDFSPFRFTTCGLLERERFAIWRERFCRALLRVDIEPKALRGSGVAGTAVKGTWSAVRFWPNRALVAEGDDSISIIIGEGCTASQRRHHVAVGTSVGVAVLTQEPVDVIFAGAPALAWLFHQLRFSDVSQCRQLDLAADPSPL